MGADEEAPSSSSSSSQADPGSARSAGPAAAAPAVVAESSHRLLTPPPLGHGGRGMGGVPPTPFNLAALAHAADIQRVAEAMAANMAVGCGDRS